VVALTGLRGMVLFAPVLPVVVALRGHALQPALMVLQIEVGLGVGAILAGLLVACTRLAPGGAAAAATLARAAGTGAAQQLNLRCCS
jgi:hypothetical protein